MINNSRFVRKEIINKVEKAIQKLNYKPNLIARNLRKKISNNIIGVIIGINTNPYFTELIQGIDDTCSGFDYNIIICNSNGNYLKEKYYINLLVQNGVKGIILDSIYDYEMLDEILKNIEIPVIIINRNINKNDIECFFVNDFNGGYLVTDYLIKLGHKRIACTTGPCVNDHCVHQRVLGYKKALLDANLPADDELILLGDYQLNDGYNTLKQLIKFSNKPTAIFFYNDLMAMGALSCASSIGLRVPDDISIIGYDDIEYANYTVPRLTTVAHPKYEIGKKLAERMIARINNKKIIPQKFVFEPELIIRDSCKKNSSI